MAFFSESPLVLLLRARPTPPLSRLLACVGAAVSRWRLAWCITSGPRSCNWTQSFIICPVSYWAHSWQSFDGGFMRWRCWPSLETIFLHLSIKQFLRSEAHSERRFCKDYQSMICVCHTCLKCSDELSDYLITPYEISFKPFWLYLTG